MRISGHCLLSFFRARGIAVARDCRTAVRSWRSNPVTTLSAYFALTLGIGVTTSIFSILNSMLLAPLPIADASRVVRIAALDSNGDSGGASAKLSLPDMLELKKRIHSANKLAFYTDRNGNLGDASRPTVVHVLETEADLFTAMGLQMSQGRPFPKDANQPGHACEAVLSWSLWQSRFHGQDMTGALIRFNESPCRVAGVLPDNLDLPLETDIWMPRNIDLGINANARGAKSFYAIARLNNGVTLTACNAELATLARQLSRENPKFDANLRLQATLLRDWLNRDVKPGLLVLFAAVLSVLLMACGNVANLLLARASARLNEMSIRVAVGATRLSLLRQLLTESLLLALLSSLSGLALSIFLVRWIRSLPNLTVPRTEAIQVDGRVVLFALLLALLTGLLFGALPAWKVSFTYIAGLLNQASGRLTETARQQIARKIMVAVETAFATVLLITSLLLLRSFQEVSRINLGFQSDHLLTAYVSLNQSRYPYGADASLFAHRVLDELKGKPGILDAAFSTSIPLQGVTSGSGLVQIEGMPLPAQQKDPPLVINTGVTSGFRKTLNIPLKAGVDLEERDDRVDATAALVNSAFARRFFPNESALGKRLRYNPDANPDAPWQQIVGVLADTRQAGPESTVKPELYRPLSRATTTIPGIILRTSDNPLSHLHDLETAVRRADAELPLFYPRSMEQVAARRLGSRRFITLLLTGFGCAALLLATGGLFAVIAYSVSQRTAEIGIRLACGATRANILWLIIRQGLFPAWAGIAVGLLSAFLLNRFLAGLLYGVKPTDAAAFLGTVFLLAFCSALAALLPAWKATKLEPWKALRHE